MIAEAEGSPGYLFIDAGAFDYEISGKIKTFNEVRFSRCVGPIHNGSF
jgi:hypothetical protein